MKEQKGKALLIFSGGAIALLAMCVWFAATQPSEMTTTETVQLKMKSSLGSFDLSKGFTTATLDQVKSVPKELLQIKSKSDAAGNIRHLVQFKTPITPAHRKAVKETGSVINGYFPDNILIVEAPKGKESALRNLQDVHAVTERPAWGSMQPNLFKYIDQEAAKKRAKNEKEELTLLVAGANGYKMHTILKAAGYTVVPGHSPARIKGNASELKAMVPNLLTLPKLSSVELRGDIKLISPPNTGTIGQRPVNESPVPAAAGAWSNVNSPGIIQDGTQDEEGNYDTPVWDNGLTGEGQIIMMVDSGLDADHGMYWDKVLPPVFDLGDAAAPDHSQRKVIAYYNAHGGPINWDQEAAYFHGTHVAGTMLGKYSSDQTLVDVYDDWGWWVAAAVGNSHKGMAYDAKLVVSDIGTTAGFIDFPSLTEAWQPAIDNAAALSNNSWGSGTWWPGDKDGAWYSSEVAEADRFHYDNPTYIACRSAGNDGWYANDYTIIVDCQAKNNICVGALGIGAADGSGMHVKADFSSEGPTQDGRFRPHIMAPGHVIISAFGDGLTTGSIINSDVWYMSGTSMSGPTACGGIALIRQYFTEPGLYSEAGFVPTGALLKAMTINSGMDLNTYRDHNGVEQSNPSVEGNIPNSTQGWGRLTLDSVLAFENDKRQTKVWDSEGDGIITGGAIEHNVNILSSDEDLRITLVWTDPAAQENANPALINNLNLKVTSPSGKEYYGNNFSDGHSIEGEYSDNLNTEECVYIKEPETGNHVITIMGVNVPGSSVEGSSKQKYALVATGNITAAAFRRIDYSAGKNSGSGGCAMNPGTSATAFLPLFLLLGVMIIRRRKLSVN